MFLDARSPLLHFLLVGGAIFALSPRREEPRRIDVSSAGLAARERAQASRDAVSALAPEKAREVDSRAIEDEVLYREALRLGIDRDDPIVRQRVIQKLLLLVEDMGGASRAPTDGELRAYFERDPSRWRLPPRLHFVHVFTARRESLPAAEVLPASGVPAAGDAFPYPRDVTGSKEELARVYGGAFAGAAFDSGEGAWSAPIASSFGWHRVRVALREPGRVPAFEEARHAIELDYAMEKREAIVGAYLKKTVGAYEVDIDGKPLVGFVPTRRVAVRADPSAED
jgi:peptidyl-prolyl cis-trans isomerase C